MFFENDPVLEKFVCILMVDGKKSTAKKIMQRCGYFLEKNWNMEAKESFYLSIENAMPALEVCSVRKGGIVYQVPVPITPERRLSLAIRWIIQNARKRKENSIAEKLANEIMLVCNNQGPTIDKRNQMHSLVEANRAFAHLRWK